MKVQTQVNAPEPRAARALTKLIVDQSAGAGLLEYYRREVEADHGTSAILIAVRPEAPQAKLAPPVEATVLLRAPDGCSTV
jgi:hypothetical protein